MENDESCIYLHELSTVLSPEPALKTAPVVHKGRIQCSICFIGTLQRDTKRAGIQKIKDITGFQEKALEWKRYNHEYRTIYENVDWPNLKEAWAHKSCKGNFFKETYMTNQPLASNEKEIDELSSFSSFSSNVENLQTMNPLLPPRRSNRQSLAYTSSGKEAVCIICNEKKYDKGREVQVKTMYLKEVNETIHKAEKKLIEYAEIHVSNNTKFKGAAEKILLTLSSKTLFVADVGYHKSCYDAFRSPKWNKKKITRNTTCKKSSVGELLNLIEYLVIVKKEIYTLAQLRGFYDQIADDNSRVLRSVDIKKEIQDKFKDKIRFCKPSDISTSNATEYVFSANESILPNAINAITTGEGLGNCLQLKNIACCISNDIQSNPKKKWPPPPQDIINSEDVCHRSLYNIIAWIVSPNSCMDGDGVVRLSKRKSTKVNEICQNIEALVPNAQPRLSQVLLSLNMYCKTGSKNIIEDLSRLGHGISYTQTMFIQDMWAEWTDNQLSYIPSNIQRGKIVTHVFDNIDWKNKNIKRTETHHTNSILVQKCDIVEDLAKINLEQNYDFERRKHRSYKGKHQDLPCVNFKRAKPRVR